MILHQFRNVFTDVHRCWPAWACAPWPRKQESSFFQSTYAYLKKKKSTSKNLYGRIHMDTCTCNSTDWHSFKPRSGMRPISAWDLHLPVSLFSVTVLILKQRLVLPVFVYSFKKKRLFSVYCWVLDSLAEHRVLEMHSRCEVVYRFREWLHHRWFIRLLLMDMWVFPRWGLLQIVLRWTYENTS